MIWNKILIGIVTARRIRTDFPIKEEGVQQIAIVISIIIKIIITAYIIFLRMFFHIAKSPFVKLSPIYKMFLYASKFISPLSVSTVDV